MLPSPFLTLPRLPYPAEAHSIQSRPPYRPPRDLSKCRAQPNSMAPHPNIYTKVRFTAGDIDHTRFPFSGSGGGVYERRSLGFVCSFDCIPILDICGLNARTHHHTHTHTAHTYECEGACKIWNILCALNKRAFHFEALN